MRKKAFRNDSDRDALPELGSAPSKPAAGSGGRSTAVQRSDQQLADVQMARAEVVDVEPEEVKQHAAVGVAGSGAKLPHLERIQTAFGPGHDLGSISAHVGGTADAASRQMGAHAFAAGDKIGFRSNPDVRLAAHEAAHVVQQRAGHLPAGGVGSAGDALERNADAVADRVAGGESAADLLPSGGGAAGAAVQQFTVETFKGEYARISESGKTICSGEENYSQSVYATDDLIDHANNELKNAGEKGSYLRLVKTGEEAKYKGNTLYEVAPVFKPQGDAANKELADANKGKGSSDTMSLWADCGRSSRVVMGSHADAAPHAEYKVGDQVKSTDSSFRPATYSDVIYMKAMPAFLANPASDKYLKEGIHYKGEKSKIIEASTPDQAREQYWKLGAAGRRAFDQFAGINTGANPEIGGGYTMNTEYDMPGFKGGRSTWNFHWAGVVMKDGSDNVTLENYADGNGYESVNMDWNFQMYGTIKKGQTFQEEHLASNTHGNRASSFAVKPKGK